MYAEWLPPRLVSCCSWCSSWLSAGQGTVQLSRCLLSLPPPHIPSLRPPGGSRNGAPSRKGCMVNDQMARQATKEYALPHPAPTYGAVFTPDDRCSFVCVGACILSSFFSFLSKPCCPRRLAQIIDLFSLGVVGHEVTRLYACFAQELRAMKGIRHDW